MRGRRQKGPTLSSNVHCSLLLVSLTHHSSLSSSNSSKSANESTMTFSTSVSNTSEMNWAVITVNQEGEWSA